MSAKVDYEFSGHTAEKLQDFIRSLLAKYCPGEPISDSDLNLLVGVLHQHPNFYTKTAGREIAGYEIRPSGKPAFFVVFKDGSSERFGWRKAARAFATGK